MDSLSQKLKEKEACDRLIRTPPLPAPPPPIACTIRNRRGHSTIYVKHATSVLRHARVDVLHLHRSILLAATRSLTARAASRSPSLSSIHATGES